jgi:type IV pilus assembly protein PilY1
VIGEEGFFSDSAYSFWSDAVDGKDETKGGAAAELSNTRNIFIGYDVIGLPTQLTTANIDTVPLSLLQTNSTGRTNNLKWLLGIDIWDDQESGSIVDANKFIADGIHTKPTVITYGGTEADPADVLFFATNLGTLHAVDPDDDKGTELWAHMAASHLSNLQAYTQSNFSPQHVYGLDGQMTSIVKPSTGTDATILVDSVYLYLGERRGGSNYYGFDVSNARIDADEKDIKIDDTHTKPFKKLFTINGALKSKPAIVANPSLATPKFQDLAQTWSAMVPAKIKYNGALKDVLIFTGGYDPRHDTSNYNSSDAVDGGASTVSDYGNAIYIVDAQTGGLLISIGNNNDDDDSDTTNVNLRDLHQHDVDLPMQDSIVASPTIVDIDNDDAVDLIFAVDIMGHVWRIDIDNTAIPADMVSGGMIADLSSSTANRRFYNALDVSRSNIRSSGSDHLNIVVGSGYRASPNADETFNSTAFSNNIYVLFDTPQVNVDTYQKVMASDLVETSSASPQSITTAPKGFFKQLDRKEKTLQRSLTFNNTIVVTTFLPGENEGNACGGGLGSNRVYALDANTGVSVLTRRDANDNPIIHDGSTNAGNDLIDGNGDIVYVNANNEIIEEWFGLKSAGIAAETTILMLRDLVVCFSAECNIDVVEEALLGDLELRKAYRSSWQEK